jgi:hypothetical protein
VPRFCAASSAISYTEMSSTSFLINSLASESMSMRRLRRMRGSVVSVADWSGSAIAALRVLLWAPNATFVYLS